MNILLIYAIVFVAIFVLAFFLKLIKGLVKVILIGGFIVSLALAGLAFYVWQDVEDFRTNFPTEPKAFYLSDEGVLLSGFAVTGLDLSTAAFFTDLDVHQASLEANPEVFAQDYFRVFILDLSLFNDSDGIPLGNYTLSGSVFEESLRSDDPLLIFTDALVEQAVEGFTELPVASQDVYREQFREDISVQFGDGERLKGVLFVVLLGEAFEREGPAFLLKGLRDGRMQVIPKTPMFKLLGLVPENVINDAMSLDLEGLPV